MIISKSYTFDAAHQLYNPALSIAENQKMFGKCSTLHGHTYTVDVAVRGIISSTTGMVLNYFDLDAVVKPFIEALDHSHLNTTLSRLASEHNTLTTAENIARIIGVKVSKSLSDRYENVFVYRVWVSETPKTKAIWTP
jgi:6-pyruvoyltetrahydropterin/6-carboxytetrahydropterin synthase